MKSSTQVWGLAGLICVFFSTFAGSCGYPGTGLSPVGDGLIIHDSNLNVSWLAEANLAADPGIRAAVAMPGVDISGINPNGTMDYPTAQNWVYSLNHFNNGQGYLNHANWQLPVSPAVDTTCAILKGHDGNSFGPFCTESALGNVYAVGLGRTFPDSVFPGVSNTVGPFQSLQPGLYWTAEHTSHGATTFSFNTDAKGMNTTRYNYLHVLPIRKGLIAGSTPGGPGVSVYVSGPAAGLAVYDSHNDTSWALNGDLPYDDSLGYGDGTLTLKESNGTTVTAPRMSNAGTMMYATTHDWLKSLNGTQFAGAGDWNLPGVLELKALARSLKLSAGDVRFAAQGSVGYFQHLQPFFYWSCPEAQQGDPLSLCSTKPAGFHHGKKMDFSFNFDSGFQGTDEESKQFYVMIYYPGS